MTAPARWVPGDDELDALARSLPASEPGPDRSEQNRTALLALAAGRTQVAHRSPRRYAAAGVALAAAATIAIWIAARPSVEVGSVASAVPKQTITPIGAARFETVKGWPDVVVRVDDGTIAVDVALLLVGERLRVKTADAEIEVRGARFDAEADTGRLVAVTVHEGWAQLQHGGQQVFLSAGQRWRAPQTAQRDEVELPEVLSRNGPANPRAAPSDRVADAAPKPVTPRPASKRAAGRVPVDPSPTPAVIAPTEPEPAPAGEAEFRAGVAAMRAGDARLATSSFASACLAARAAALGEDACFWVGAAAKRAGDNATARTALTRFLHRFPASPRVAEASALLGWIVYDAGDLARAEELFRTAEHDRVPEVQDSARRGLTAIERTRRK